MGTVMSKTHHNPFLYVYRRGTGAVEPLLQPCDDQPHAPSAVWQYRVTTFTNQAQVVT